VQFCEDAILDAFMLAEKLGEAQLDPARLRPAFQQGLAIPNYKKCNEEKTQRQATRVKLFLRTSPAGL
jgi:hypothetical protein